MTFKIVLEHRMIYVGPWASRWSFGSGRFGYRCDASRWVRFRSRWWSGWHRWKEEIG
jgi:hypothetical protein